MTDSLDQAPASTPGRWVKGMPSPCPTGRPKGILDKRSRVTKALMEDAPAIARVVIDKALDGDMQAAGLVFARVAPAIKQQAEKVEFDLSPDRPLGEQAQQWRRGRWTPKPDAP
jgi:hypothetical protein